MTGTDDKRDAVHVAVIAVTAMRHMEPGERLQNGIVDPFLLDPVKPGERFWLFLYPNTVTSLRHVWEHSAYPTEQQSEPKKRSECDVWRDVLGDDRYAAPITENTIKTIRQLKDRVFGSSELHRSFDALPVPPKESK